MALWDFLKRNKKDVFQDYADNMQPLQPIQQEIPLVQATPNDMGGVDAVVGQWQPKPSRTQRFKTKLSNMLLGTKAEPTDSIDLTNGALSVSISDSPRIGGILPDIMSGARENFATGFAADNLGDNMTADGRRKGFAYRLGEGLGSIGRVLESPLGRGLLTAGAVGVAGGNGADMLAYGLQGGTLNQQLRKADNLYRQQLKDNYGFTDDQLNQVKGYINNDTFNSLTKSSYNMQRAQNQLAIAMQKDNTARARMIMQGLNNGSITPETAEQMIQAYGITNADFQESNNTRNTNINEYLAPHRANLYDSGGYAAITNAGANTTRANAYEFDVRNNRGNNPPTKAEILQNPVVRSNLVEYKKTTNSKERQKMDEWFVNNTGYTADYLLGVI